jgi:D-apionolactonase
MLVIGRAAQRSLGYDSQEHPCTDASDEGAGWHVQLFYRTESKTAPLDLLDFVTFTTVAIFHAGDDRSAMEGLESLPYLARSLQAFIDGKPYHVGPSAIGLRMNPYGETPMANPHNIRQAMNRMDPRQRGLFAGAWSVGFVAQFAKCGASAITLGEAVGELGIVYGKTDYSQPWFEENGGVYPVYHAMKGLAALRGKAAYRFSHFQASRNPSNRGCTRWRGRDLGCQPDGPNQERRASA